MESSGCTEVLLEGVFIPWTEDEYGEVEDEASGDGPSEAVAFDIGVGFCVLGVSSVAVDSEESFAPMFGTSFSGSFSTVC